MKKSLLTLAISILMSGCSINSNPGVGEKIGQIVKLSKQGIIRTTWEAELIRGGMNNGSGSFGTKPFDFTIEDDEMAKRIAQYLQDQQEVIISYRTEYCFSWFRTDSDGNFLISISPVTNNAAK